MDRYIAEMDESNRIAAVWVMKKTARGPSVFDPSKHYFDPRRPAEFVGAPQRDIVKWLDTANGKRQTPALRGQAAQLKPAGILSDRFN